MDGKSTVCDEMNRVRAEEHSLFWPAHYNLIAGNRCQHAKHTRLGFKMLSILGGIITVQTTEQHCFLWGFSYNWYLETHCFYTSLYVNANYTNSWGWVKQVSASWATPAQRVIWYANNVDPWSRSDRVAICWQATETLADETSSSNPSAFSRLKITYLPRLLFY